MKAQVRKWCEGDRVRLCDVAPLDTPISLMIEPSSICNLKCHYCSVSNKAQNSKRKATILDYDDYKKLINDCKMFNKDIKAINFSRLGEPLLNKRTPDMIKLAKNSGKFEISKLITNGLLLSPEYNIQLINSGLDILRISVQALSEKEIYDICGIKINLKDFISNIKHYYKNRGSSRVFIKIIDKAVKGKENEFYNMFGDICDEISIEHLIPVNNHIAKNEISSDSHVNMMGETVETEYICSSPFYSINVCASGNISPCCADITEEINFGNIKNNSVVDVWNSSILNRFRLMQLKGERYNHNICSKCSAPTFSKQANDSLITCKERLIDYYKKNI